MDVWVFMAGRGDSAPVVIAVFAVAPTEEMKMAALRTHIERKIGWADYEPGDEKLRREDIERSIYHWPKQNWRCFCKSLRGPDVYTTRDGYTLKRNPNDGTYSDGDLKFDSIAHLLIHDSVPESV